TAGLDIPVSVNVGAQQLLHKDFVINLSAALARYPTVKPCYLELEILETSALEDIAKVSMVMRACHDIGVSFALDDFGTGYSSLTHLKRLPADLLKIDQSFVRDMLVDADDRSIVTAVIALASTFKRQVIAEGVETAAHGAQLIAMGCVLAQGYGIARPMPAELMAEWIGNWKADPSWCVKNP
ncbi:MAG: EAL domain-containing protein, partial [Psychromonas sp.]